MKQWKDKTMPVGSNAQSLDYTPLCKLIETNIKNTKNLVFLKIFYSMNVSVHILVHNMTTAIIKKHFDAFGH